MLRDSGVGLGLLLAGFGVSAAVLADAGFVERHPVFPPGETAVCAVVVKAPMHPARAILPNNPVDRLGLMPAVCSGGGMSQSEIPGGIRQLLQAGWRIAHVSHQVTNLGAGAPVSADGSVELLVSGIFVLERQLFVGGR